MRFSTRERFRPTSCAFSGSFQKPGADISRSISSSDFLAEARSKIAPDGGEAVLEGGDFLEGVVVHGLFDNFEFRISNSELRSKLKLQTSFSILNSLFEIRNSSSPHHPDHTQHHSHPRKPISPSHICRHRPPRLK